MGQQRSLTLAQHLEAEVLLKSLMSIAQTAGYWFWFAGWVKIRIRCLALPEIFHLLLGLSVSFEEKAENRMWNLKCLLEMKNWEVLNFENVRMKHFIFFTSGGGRRQDCAGVETQCWLISGRSPAPSAHFPWGERKAFTQPNIPGPPVPRRSQAGRCAHWSSWSRSGMRATSP